MGIKAYKSIFHRVVPDQITGFLALSRGFDWSFFSTPQPHIPYEKSSPAVSASFHIKFHEEMRPQFCCLSSGLMYFSSMSILKYKDDEDAVSVIFNPRTRRYAILPKLGTHQKFSYLGFDPIDKQFKVLSMASPYLAPNNDHKILTLGTGDMRWRNIQCPHHSLYLHEGICINGFVYFLATRIYYDDRRDREVERVIVYFDFRSEKFEFIDYVEGFYTAKMINYKGKLGGIAQKTVGNTLELRVWVLEDVEKQEWGKFVYTLLDDKLIGRNVFIVGVTATGEIVLSVYYTSKPFYVFYFNLERNTLQSVEVQGLGKYYEENRHRVHAFVNYVEDLNVNDAKELKLSQGLNIIRRRPKPQKPPTSPILKNKQATSRLQSKYQLLANIE